MEEKAFLRLIIFSLAFSFLESIESVSRDAMSLLSFRISVSDPSNLLFDWKLAGKSHCDWYGVACDKVSGRVTALNITGNQFPDPQGSRSNFPTEKFLLAGTLTPSIANLTELRILSIPYNTFSGEVPIEIADLRSLEILELQGNNFSGRIPDQLSNLSSLRILNLSYNSFSGPIPNNLIGLSRIQLIDLSYNQLSGRITVNRHSHCESLTHLHLSANFLVDKIPPEIGYCSNIKSLLLDGNILEGPIPAEIGWISELRILDVSRNSLTDRLPKELANCSRLEVLVLTNFISAEPVDSFAVSSRGEFNAFVGGVPFEILLLQSLEILWAPRANINGGLPENWSSLCKLRILNLGQNYLSGSIPRRLGMCRSLSFVDLSSNNLQGVLPSEFPVQCMIYFNVSRNSLSGLLPEFVHNSCNQSGDPLGMEIPENAYSAALLGSWMINPFESALDGDFVVLHDFSWNTFVGSLPKFLFGDGLFSADHRLSYGLLLNNNQFNDSFPEKLFSECKHVQSFRVNLSVNQISGGISFGSLLSCLQLKEFEAANNQLRGSIPLSIGDLQELSHLDLSGNSLNGTLPTQLGQLKNLRSIHLGRNSLTGEIPSQLGQLTLLAVLDLSQNTLNGNIPATLVNASNLEVLLLNHNRLSGEIPSSLSMLQKLRELDVSFNNLSGHIPRLEHVTDCNSYRDNSFLQPCPDPNWLSPSKVPFPLEVKQSGGRSSKLKSIGITTVASASVIVFILLVLILVLLFGRRKLVRLSSLRRKIVITFTDAPAELNYDNVIRATGNFSIRNLIGTGGFGATYKAELAPGFLVAVKRLSMGRFQGLQQFDAEIRTLGRIRHKNLVTLIGYHMGEAETFLIYNFLSGGNLETFIHDRLGKNVHWSVIHKIALDVAHALAYLHDSCVPRIVHRDIKPSNILLDEQLNAYLSDFGLARLLEVSETHATTDVAGTFGYVAPEYATTCRVSDKADVYSFGIVLLELMSGKRSIDPSFSEYGDGFNIVSWGKLLIEEGRSSELFSSTLWEAGPKEKLVGMLKLALACTAESLSVRPSMKQVVERLIQLRNS